MKVLFIDIDGVFNTDRGRRASPFGKDYIDEALLLNLRKIVYATKAELVLSSTWRIMSEDRMMVQRALHKLGMQLFDKTPKLPGEVRDDEIRQWLAENKKRFSIERWAVLDDDRKADLKDGSFFRTNEREGCTAKIADAVIEYLNFVPEAPVKETKQCNG
jgi:hypothetical protein